MKSFASPLMILLVVFCGCAISGCPQNVTLITFTIDDPKPVEEFEFAPVVMQDGTLRYPPCYVKTPDMSGYNRYEVTLNDPENLWSGWETTGISHYERVGIVVMRRNVQDEGGGSPRLYWFSEADRLASGDRVVNIPKLDSLPILETQPVK